MERAVAEGAGERWNSVDVSRRSLANMLSLPSSNIPIDKRLEMDFLNQEPTNPDCGLKQMPEIKPEPILFRVNIPQKPHCERSISSLDSLESLEKELDLINKELSEITPSATAYGVPSLQIPQMPQMPQIESPRIPSDRLKSNISSPFTKTKREKKHRNLLYKTPLPKTVRIHYATPSPTKRKSIKKININNTKKKATTTTKKRRKTGNNMQNRKVVSNFFRNLTK